MPTRGLRPATLQRKERQRQAAEALINRYAYYQEPMTREGLDTLNNAQLITLGSRLNIRSIDVDGESQNFGRMQMGEKRRALKRYTNTDPAYLARLAAQSRPPLPQPPPPFVPRQSPPPPPRPEPASLFLPARLDLRSMGPASAEPRLGYPAAMYPLQRSEGLAMEPRRQQPDVFLGSTFEVPDLTGSAARQHSSAESGLQPFEAEVATPDTGSVPGNHGGEGMSEEARMFLEAVDRAEAGRVPEEVTYLEDEDEVPDLTGSAALQYGGTEGRLQPPDAAAVTPDNESVPGMPGLSVEEVENLDFDSLFPHFNGGVWGFD